MSMCPSTVVRGRLGAPDSVALDDVDPHHTVRELFADATDADVAAYLGGHSLGCADVWMWEHYITNNHQGLQQAKTKSGEESIIPDFRLPHGMRLGLSPLGTELDCGMTAIARALEGELP